MLNCNLFTKAKMKSLSIRNLSDDTYAHLQFLARSNRRSLQEQIKCLLEQ